MPDAPNTGSNSHKAGNIVGLGNQVVSLLRTPAAAEAEGGPRDRNRPGATMRLSDQIREEMEDGNVTLLPTPESADASGGRVSAELGGTRPSGAKRSITLATAIHHRLLPTPEAKLASSGPDYARMNREGAGGDDLTTTLWREGMHLLPTSVAQPSGNTPEEHLRKKPGRAVVTDLAIITENGLSESGGRLLPTPAASLGDHRRDYGQPPESRVAGGHSVSTADAARGLSDSGVGWGPYEVAIRRWEAIIGRPAPAPVKFDGKGGKPRLNPELTEWMMGWPAGWVTDPTIGITRADQLKACGNGVVPMQAAMALLEMLARRGVPAIDYALAA